MNIRGNLIKLLRYINRLGLASGASSFFKDKDREYEQHTP